MIPDYNRIGVGQLFIVDKPFWTTGEDSGKRLTKSKFVKGDIIEIRYPYEWHFRDEQQEYHHAKTVTLTKNCTFYGKIHEEIRFGNKHNLKEILEQKLFHTSKDFELKLKSAVK